MNMWDIFRSNKKTSAHIAKERLLQLIVDQGVHSKIKFDVDKLQAELIEVIARYFPIDNDRVRIEVDRNENRSTLELNVVLPEDA